MDSIKLNSLRKYQIAFVIIVESLEEMIEMPQRTVAFASIPIRLVPYTPQPGSEVYNFDTSFLQHSKKV